MPFIDYSKTNPFALLDASHIRQITEALRHYHETRDADPHLLMLAEYADEEFAREEASDDPREAVLDAKTADAIGAPGPADGATNVDEYAAKYPRQHKL